ncbi:MAG: hypothetical protein KDA93_09885 [Planctomycetaceae bacterium]|nr:hypothetical protein [Planctomycetaceae bacterium]
MKRFHSPLQRLLRLREQAERMTQLSVSRARANVDASASRLAAVEDVEEGQLCELTQRLNQSEQLLILAQINDSYREQQVHVQSARAEQAMFQSLVVDAISENHTARQAREMVERMLNRQRDAHRRETLNAAAVDLQEWSLRRTAASKAEQSMEAPHA